MEEKIRVVVAGGGTAGWLTAYSLVKRLSNLLEITLVESDRIGTVGVGEATVPTMRNFHHIFEIDEREFMRATQATFKLGIFFDNWGAPRRKLHSHVRCCRGKVPGWRDSTSTGWKRMPMVLAAAWRTIASN